MDNYPSILGRLHLAEQASQVNLGPNEDRTLNIHLWPTSCLIAGFQGWLPSLSFSGKPRNRGHRGVAMVQWNAEKLNSLKARKLERHLFWLWFWVYVLGPKLPA